MLNFYVTTGFSDVYGSGLTTIDVAYQFPGSLVSE
jgi:hypothetical protein